MAAATETGVRPALEAPYVGLTHFTEEHADLFFGRDEESSIIIGNLRAARLTLLYAESGVGKSSLLRAGVAARLREQATRDAEVRGAPRFVPVVFSAWTEEPLSRLIEAIEQAVQPFAADASPLELPRDRLDDAIARATAAVDTTLLLVLDQFEEYFLYSEREHAFADHVARCVNADEFAANFLISIREDSYARLGDLFRGRIANVYANFLHLEFLSREGARAAIVKPLELYNAARPGAEPVTAEPALVDAVLDGVRRAGAEENGASPRGPRGAGAGDAVETTYLQLVMKRLWDTEAERGSTNLRLETLESLGGAHAIIATHLDRAMAELTPDQQDAAASIFRFLVTTGGTKIAWSVTDLADLSNVPQAELDPVLRRRAGADLKIVRPVAVRDGAAPASYEIFHDALARPIVAWRRAHEEEQRRKKEGAELVRQREQERRKRRRRLLVVAIALAVVAAGAVAATALRGAQREKELRRSGDLTEQSIAALGVDPARSVRLALDAVGASATPQAERALRVGYANLRERVRLRGHTDLVRSAAFTRGGNFVASGSEDGTVRIWDVKRRRPYRVLRHVVPDGEFVWHVSFSRDGAYLLEAGTDAVVRVWKWRDRESKPLAKIETPVALRSAEFSSDGKYIAAVGDDGVLRVWDWRADPPKLVFKRLDPLAEADDYLWDVTWDSRNRIMTGGSVGDADAYVAHIWRLGRKKPVATLAYHSKFIESVAFSPDGKRAATASDDKWVCVWDIDTDAPGCVWSVRAPAIPQSVRFSPDGDYLVVAQEDGTATVYDWRAERALIDLRGHGDAVFDARFDGTGARVVTASQDRTVRIWDTAPVTSITPGHEDSHVSRVAFEQRGTRLAVAVEDDDAFIWDRARKKKKIDTGHVVTDVDFDRTGTRLVTAEESWAQISPVGAKTLGPVRPLRDDDEHTDDVVSARFSRDGKWVVTASRDWTAKIWNASTGDLRRTLGGRHGHNDWVYSAAFSPDGTRVVTASDDGTAKIWNAATGGLVRTLRPSASKVNDAQYSPDGSVVATASGDGVARIWDADSGERVGELVGHTGAVWTARFNRDGTRIVTASDDGTTRVWDAATQELLAINRQHADAVNEAVFSPNGRWIGSASDDGTAKVYRCDECIPLEQLEQSARRLVRRLNG